MDLQIMMKGGEIPHATSGRWRGVVGHAAFVPKPNPSEREREGLPRRGRGNLTRRHLFCLPARLFCMTELADSSRCIRKKHPQGGAKKLEENGRCGDKIKIT
jgi:hypothetical protein